MDFVSSGVGVYSYSWTNRTPASRSSDFVITPFDYKPNQTPLSPITIINWSVVFLQFLLTELIHTPSWTKFIHIFEVI